MTPTPPPDDASPALAVPIAAVALAAVQPPAIDAGLASERFLSLIPREFARAHLILSQGALPDGGERLAIAATTSKASIWNTGVRLQAPVKPELADAEVLARTIDEAYAARAPPKPALDATPTDTATAARLEDLIREADQDLLQTQGKSRVVQLVDALLFEAVGRNASDIHVQPTDEATLVRYRVDGALTTVRELPKSLASPILGRVKVMGRMDVAERRVPQDGRATVTIGSENGRAIDLRIGVFPTSYGERAVLRILDPTRRVDDLESLGMPSDIRERLLACTGRADGFVLVTGPTGAGKTTTLYAALKKIASPDLNVMTIEDPIEYDLAATGLPVSQSQVNLKKGVSFATGLRHLLRQDPDVILVGEIRDAETARMAIQSSLTGHLVLSTLHTNDAPSAVTRLVDLGVEPFLVSASLAAVLAQRLVRTIHRPCGGGGCTACLSTGFLGRRGLFELMVIDEVSQRLIARGADLNDLRAAARKGGMRTLREEGERLIAAGETTAVEVERVVQGAVT